jgi:hypothetical protein
MQASLFFVKGERQVGDPASIKERALVVYGEALAGDDSRVPSSRTYCEGSKLYRLEWLGPRSEFESLLRASYWDHPKGEIRFSLGLSQRPPLISLPAASLNSAGYDADLLPVAATGSPVHVFVCTQKSHLAAAVAAACKEEDIAIKVMERLRDLTGRDLLRRHVGMFGDVYLVERKRGTDAEPVRWNVPNDPDGTAGRVVVEINEAAVGDNLMINLRVYGADSIVVDDLVLQWSRGMKPCCEISLNQEVGGVWLRAWDGRGCLVAESAHYLLREVQLSCLVSSGAVRLRDKLTEKTERALQGRAGSAEILNQLAVVPQGTAIRTSVAIPDAEPWSTVRFSAAEAVHQLIPAPAEENAYFRAGPEGRAQAIVELVRRIRGANEAILVDPYFDAEGGMALVHRLAGADVPVTILTWLQDAETPVALLRAGIQLANKEKLLPRRLEILQLPGKQPFHDRFLLLSGDGTLKIDMLSNSLSGLARNHPLVIARLSDEVARSVARDVQKSLADARGRGRRLWPEDPGGTSLQQTDAGPRPESAELFAGWKVVVSIVAKGAVGSDEECISKACEAGLMVLQDAGGIRWQFHGGLAEAVRDGFHRLLVERVSEIGSTLCLMGEAEARGALVDPAGAADTLRTAFGAEASTGAIFDYLRASFAPPATGRQRGLVEFCFRSDPSMDLAQAAFLARNCRMRELTGWPHLWGREFAILVLAHLDPRGATALSEELQDMTLLAVAAGEFYDRFRGLNAVAEAMVQARSPFLRALGAQLLVVPRPRGLGNHWIQAPDNVVEGARVLRELGIPPAELVAYLVLWTRGIEDDRRREQLADVLLIELIRPELEGECRDKALYSCLVHSTWVFPLVQARIALSNQPSASTVCESLLRVLGRWLDVAESDDSQLSIDRSYLPVLQAFAYSVDRVARESGSTSIAVLHEAVLLENKLKLTRPVSPLAQRPGRVAAVHALGCIYICSLLSESEDLREHGRKEGKALLDAFTDDLPAALREILNEFANGAEATGGRAETS